MSLLFHLGWWLLALSLSLNIPVSASDQPEPSVSTTQNSSDETALRSLTEAYYKTWAAKELDGFLNLWSAKSPEIEARRKSTQDFFANSERIEVRGLLFRRFVVDGEKANLRVEVNVTVIDAKSKKEREGYGKTPRTLECVKGSGSWKVLREISTFDELAEAIVSAKTDQERSAIVESLDSEGAMATTLNRAGQLFRIQGKYEQALSFFRRARDLSEAADNKAEMSKSLQRIGEVSQVLGKYDDALDAYHKSFALAEASNSRGTMSDVRGRLSILYSLLGRTDAGLEEVEKSLSIAIELNDTYRIANGLLRKGNIYLTRSELAQAAELYQQAIALAEKIGDKTLMDPCLNNLGMIYRAQGDYRPALQYMERSLKLAEEFGDKANIAQTLNSIGIVYSRQGNQDVAMDYYARSLSLLGNSRGRTVVDTVQNIGEAATHLGNYEQALESFRKALSLAESSKDSPTAANALAGIGDVYYKFNKFDEAASYFQRALELNEKVGSREATAKSLLALGLNRLRQGNAAQAIELATRADSLNMEIGDREITVLHRELIGRAYLTLNDTHKARQAFDEGIAALESIRAEVAGGAEAQRFFLGDRLYPYRAMIELLVLQNQTREALTYAERSKARAVLDVLHNGRLDIHGAMTAEERRQENGLKEGLFSLNRRLTQATQSADQQRQKISELRAQVEKARLNYEAFQTSLYAAHPELRARRGEAPIINAQGLTSLLPDDKTALLEYTVNDERTYLFIVSRAPDKALDKAEAVIHVHMLPVKRSDLAHRIEAFREQLANRDLGFRPAATELYDLLLKPAAAQLAGKKHLVIVPDDRLWDLPFQSLLSGDGRFLIEDAAIAYAPSLTVLREMSNRRKRQGTDADSTMLLAVGNPDFGKETIERATLEMRDEKLTPLPLAEEEVRALGRLFGATRSKVYVRAEAREDRVKTEAGRASVLHFATHGTLNNASPMYSYLALAQGDANEDGLLEAWELAQMDLKADLAVLSACETARGRYGAGEGVIGLTWALFVAGVPSTVVSQWKVESASTRDLMLSFHRQLRTPSAGAKAPVTKAEALRQAALKVMKNSETSHPFYWAGFVLVGDGR